MDYRTVKLDNFELEVEVGVVPTHSTSDFLAALSVSNTLAKSDYEEFLLSSLIRNFNRLAKRLSNIEDEQDRKMLRFNLLELIYKFNSKLKPDRVIIHDDRLLHMMDSVKNGGPSEPTLVMNPGWIESGGGDVDVNSKLLLDLVDEIWEEVKKDTTRDYHMEEVKILGMSIPILKVSSINLNVEEFIVEYLLKKCDGNLFLAKNDKRLWIGYVIAFAIPAIPHVVKALEEGNFIKTYTDNVVYTQLYMAILKVNPELNYDLIDWDVFLAFYKVYKNGGVFEI